MGHVFSDNGNTSFSVAEYCVYFGDEKKPFNNTHLSFIFVLSEKRNVLHKRVGSKLKSKSLKCLEADEMRIMYVFDEIYKCVKLFLLIWSI